MMLFPRTLEELAGQRGTPRAGGTDLQDRRRLGLSTGPIVDLRDLTGLDAITWNPDGSVAIGARTTIAQLAADDQLKARYPGFAAAAGGLATPQIREVATLGGNLLQQVRCWYYRHPNLRCLRSGGTSCLAREGDHLFHACFDQGPCAAPHPSTMAAALLAYDATVELRDGQRLTAAELVGNGSDPTQSHSLQPGQLLTRVHLPPAVPGELGAYLRATNRTRAEWPLVEAVVRVRLAGGSFEQVAIALGGVANTPLRIQALEAALAGQPATLKVIDDRSKVAVNGAKPLPGTGYKLDLIPGVIASALVLALKQQPGDKPAGGAL